MAEILRKLFEDAAVHSINDYDKYRLLCSHNGDNAVYKSFNGQDVGFLLGYSIPSC